MKKSLLFIAVLSLASFAAPKKYNISLTAPAKAGVVELAPGSYKVQVDGDKVLFTDAKNKTVTVPVKVETQKAKFHETAVESSSKSGQEQIDAIDLGGTNTKVAISY
ncbi:MAG TPA: hypothetical protein VML19_10835 [Verrucomicrobiae bacterium]|nr:hypothetical protein [Verrucomicrobiae bacterium]